MDYFRYLQDELKLCLNEQQKEAICAQEKRILLEACPGSGKTTTLIARLGYLVLSKKISPQDILTLTFSRFTAKDMEKRFVRLFGNRINQSIRFSTIHSFCYQFLFHCQNKGVLKVPQLLEQYSNSKVRILGKIYYDIHGEFLSEDRAFELSNDVGFVKNKLKSPFQYKSNFQSFPVIYQKYEAYKKNNNLMDFDDILSAAFEVISRNKNLYLDYGKFKYINVDEVQDTSLLQHKIIEQISQNEHLFMVGDIDQSIYSFRGAEPDYILDIKALFPETKILKLETNYRSTKSIVKISNEIIRQNQFRNKKNMRTDNEEGEAPKVIYAKDIEKQVEMVMQLINKSSSDVKTAVLYRNNLSGLPIAYSMIVNGHPFDIRENYAGFFRHIVIKDVFAFFELSDNFSDLSSFMRVYYKMGAPISKTVVQNIKERIASNTDIFSQLYNLYKHSRYMIEQISRVRKALRKIRVCRPEKALDIIEHDLQYNSFLKRNPCSINVFSLLKYFARGVKTTDELKTRLRTLKNGIEQYYTRTLDARVSLLTLHGSKGLEFDKVILIDLVEGQLPSEKALEDLTLSNRKTYEEDIRLFYVGVTRAIKELFLIVPEKVNGKKMTPSRFIDTFKMPNEKEPR